MMSRAGKFSAAYSVHLDERAQLAEELMSSIDQDDDADDDHSFTEVDRLVNLAADTRDVENR